MYEPFLSVSRLLFVRPKRRAVVAISLIVNLFFLLVDSITRDKFLLCETNLSGFALVLARCVLVPLSVVHLSLSVYLSLPNLNI